MIHTFQNLMYVVAKFNIFLKDSKMDFKLNSKNYLYTISTLMEITDRHLVGTLLKLTFSYLEK